MATRQASSVSAALTERRSSAITSAQEAVDDCKEAIKLKQDSLKTIIVAVKALRGMKDFQKALDMLEIAEQIPDVDLKLVDKYRRETTREMKEHMLKI